MPTDTDTAAAFRSVRRLMAWLGSKLNCISHADGMMEVNYSVTWTLADSTVESDCGVWTGLTRLLRRAPCPAKGNFVGSVFGQEENCFQKPR